jgi:protein involved in polysaccharide export with SLBB domain
VSTEAETAITPAIANATAKRCLARKTSGDTTGITPMALWLANQGARTMWLASILKTAATISAVFVVAGITWAVEGNGGGGNAPSPTKASAKADLSVVTPQSDAAKLAMQPTPASTNAFADSLDRNAADLEAELNRNNDEMADFSAELEVLQLRKESLQTEVRVLIQEVRSQTPVPDSADEATRKKVDATVKTLSASEADYKKAVREIAQLTASIDKRQRKVRRNQELLDNIDQLRNQIKLQQILETAKASSGASTAPPATDYRIQTQDVLTVQAVGTLADQPLADSYYVEPMGTVALGPTYGRVKVAGLTILEAEQAIKKKLSEVVDPENLRVQATLAASQTSSKNQQPVNETEPRAGRLQLQVETDSLQKSSKGDPDSGRVVRRGDQIVVFVTEKSGERAVSRATVNDGGTVGLPLLKVEGLTERQAKKAIQKAVSLNNPGAEVGVDVISSPQ